MALWPDGLMDRQGLSNARHHSTGVRRVQTPQLQHDEEQEEDDGTARDEEVLPVLPEAPAAQGAEVGPEASSSIGRAPVSKTGGWGFDSLLACHPSLV